MEAKVRLPLYLSWKQLKNVLGWPYGRTHTARFMNDPAYAHLGFPKARKIGVGRNPHPIWYTPDILAFFKRHGLQTPDDVAFT